MECPALAGHHCDPIRVFLYRVNAVIEVFVVPRQGEVSNNTVVALHNF